MTKKEAAEILDLVIERAPKLREAGVIVLVADGLSIKLLPEAPKSGPEQKYEKPDPDIWKDEMLFPKRREDQREKG